jgi:hypothetical protein
MGCVLFDFTITGVVGARIQQSTGARRQRPAPESNKALARLRAAARIKLGGSVGAGLGSIGLAGAASGRIGVQITPPLAVSYPITAAGTAFFDSDSWTSNALLVEFVPLGSMLSMGAGPSIVSGTVTHTCLLGGDCSPPPSTRDYLGCGFDARMGYTFGANRPHIRGGFTLELDLHLSPEDTVVTTGIGFDIF